LTARAIEPAKMPARVARPIGIAQAIGRLLARYHAPIRAAVVSIAFISSPLFSASLADIKTVAQFQGCL